MGIGRQTVGEVTLRAKKRVFISACESSAELHCANLIRAVNQKLYGHGGSESTSDNAASQPEGTSAGFAGPSGENAPSQTNGTGSAVGIQPVAGEASYDIEWVGIGGVRMAAAGCVLQENTVQRAAMIYNAFKQVGFYWLLLRRIKAYFRNNKVDLVVVCDSPAFNFHIAKLAKDAGIPVLFYVAPQLWAWASWRIDKLRRLSDKLACILPFEQDWFASRGVDVTFVGNPLFDSVAIDFAGSCRSYDGFDPEHARIVLLPGSRKAEITSLWPAMQQIAMRIRQKWVGTEFVVSASDDARLESLKDTQISGFDCEYVVSDVLETSRNSDFALVASGSATLQVAAAGCPMAVMYQSSRLMWHLVGRWLIKSPHLSLVNILAERRLVSEFMPYFSSIDPIVKNCTDILGNNDELARISGELMDLVKPLIRGRSADRVADIAIDMIGDE